ncbi:membrane-bound PQQ-dependent dehydrogenase, glucose/quinate/shikimate family [Siculibacillus lacustris]|uniref:Membrane-bound PQQ-dependent dehydrogenase, glucose/quinate/shikimate family n=1 Tax=Siculibacillus lacustris TaxID=1549641 RepID=A0A4Q9VVR7_9HYPH|nr:membrane-bound PQQ-dependent dehydrogenase, glucose/quinate/shikimate family [Siculibacillus lacustris]TBW40367.1 membrane-bound PQQ-dependent dehydrogenase, glucose/quinate/shikimate family [Siculibacillus lacustris]
MTRDRFFTALGRGIGIVLFLIGAALGAAGLWLVQLDGSWYYAAAGAALIVTAIPATVGHVAAPWLYGLFLLLTTGWAVTEVGFDGWRLLPRLDLWIGLGLVLALPWLFGRAIRGRGDALSPIVASVVVAGGVLAAGFLQPAPGLSGRIDRPPHAPVGAPATVADGDWTAYGRSGRGDRFAPAAQITPDNVSGLSVAWTYHTRDLKGPGDPKEIANEATPLAANGLLYLCTPHNIVVALDPDSGREVWRHDPGIDRDAAAYQHMICRGVSYWDGVGHVPAPVVPAAVEAPSDPAAPTAPAIPAPAPSAGPASSVAPVATPSAACARRIFAPTADATIIALDADTGAPCRAFGRDGVVDLKAGHGAIQRGRLNPTSPPTATRDILIAAASVTDNESTDEPSGVVMGFDVDSGRLVWNWDSGNPDETEPLPLGRSYVHNSPNSWSVASVDESLGLVYLPMGNQTPDIWGGNRTVEGERFNSSIVALELATGRLRWVQQTVHHDLWDMDIGGQPSLVDLRRPSGEVVPAIVASTKRGDLWVMDRRDGQLLVPAPEKPVPQGAAEGDRVAPTQPFSQLTFTPAPLREVDMWGATPFDHLACRILFKGLRYDGIFTPPSEQGSLVYPGNYGVFDWGGITIDPTRQILVGNPNYVAFVSRLHRRSAETAAGATGSEQGLQPMTGTPFAVDLHPLLSPIGVPCQAPPWGFVASVDLTTMTRVWMHPNGTTEDQAPFGMRLPVGVPSLGGAITTGGGVVFMAASLDSYLRAYDIRSGETLWQARLPAGGQATPMSFVAPKSGRQYVVVMAGGHGSLGTKMGDSLIAYALPTGATRP